MSGLYEIRTRYVPGKYQAGAQYIVSINTWTIPINYRFVFCMHPEIARLVLDKYQVHTRLYTASLHPCEVEGSLTGLINMTCFTRCWIIKFKDNK